MELTDDIEIKGKCKKHGELTRETAIVCKDSNLPKGYRLRCKQCVYETRVNGYYRNREENIRKAQEWKKDNRDRVNASAKKNYYLDLELTRMKEASRKKKLNLEEFQRMLDECDNKCHICGNPETRINKVGEVSKRLSIDHCHTTMKIRGLLCHDCNTGLGKYKDSIELLESAIRYLRKHE